MKNNKLYSYAVLVCMMLGSLGTKAQCYTPLYPSGNIVTDPECNNYPNTGSGWAKAWGNGALISGANAYCGTSIRITGSCGGSIDYTLTGKLLPNTSYRLKCMLYSDKEAYITLNGCGINGSTADFQVMKNNGSTWKVVDFYFITGNLASGGQNFWLNSCTGSNRATDIRLDNLEIYPATEPIIIDPTQHWSANWIWQSSDSPQDTWMNFRKKVSLASVPTKAIAHISAESKYWLWINGNLVVFEGQLKRDMMKKTYFDEIDLAPYLVAGENTIAASVWYWGKDGFAHHDCGKGGFLFDADFGGTPVLSDSTWKVKAHPGYEHSTTGGQPNSRLSEWNVRFNASKDSISGWQNSGYDDTNWAKATKKGIAPALPWNALIKRSIPQ